MFYAFLAATKSGNVFHVHNDAPGCCIEAAFQGSSGQEQTLNLACGEIVSIGEADVFWRAITTNNSIQVTIHDHHEYSLVGLPSDPILSQLLRETPSLQVLEFYEFLFKEDHCRALETLQRWISRLK
jgi:hypothetical protein